MQYSLDLYTESREEVDRVLAPFRISTTIQQGIYFGYPDCCIKAFVLSRFFNQGGPYLTAEDTPFDGSGFIPCPEHRHIAVKQVEAQINSRRYARMPYRHDLENHVHHHEAREAYSSLMQKDKAFQRKWQNCARSIGLF